jgi:alkylation response protein AidB-like acyl-CoA dehydrogenase
MGVLDRTDLDFLLFDWLGIEHLAGTARHAGQDRADYTAFLDLGGRIAKDHFLPCYKISDREEPALGPDGRVMVQPQLAAAVRTYLDAGLHLAGVELDHGGMQFPMSVVTAMMAEIMAANVAGSGFLMLSAANSRLIRDHGTPRQIELFAGPQHEGRALGTMCLSEPDTGSSLGDIVTRAVADGDDDIGRRYRITGRKMWISAGDQDIVPGLTHLVLAKIADADGSLPAGSKGISLFIVPRVLPDGGENDVTVIGLNHKMGYRGTPNCAVNFGDGHFRPGGKAGAVGYLLGQSGQGLAIMFQMMNEARINVGLSGAAIASRAYLLARDYARARTQGRPLQDKKAPKPVAIIHHPDIRRMLLTQRAIAEGSMALCLYCASLVDRIAASHDPAERETAQKLLDLLTPVTKSWPSEQGMIATSHAIQIHGGSGYTRDFDVEQLYRDNRLNPIHEGTTGIQGLDLMGRKLLLDRGQAFCLLCERIAATEADAVKHAELAGMAETLREIRSRIADDVATLLAEPDPAAVLAHATTFLQAFGHFVLGWLWLDMTTAARRLDHPLAEAKLWTCRHFFDSEIPLVAAWLAPLSARSAVTSEIPDHLL